jgi:hypothetical protein
VTYDQVSPLIHARHDQGFATATYPTQVPLLQHVTNDQVSLLHCDITRLGHVNATYHNRSVQTTENLPKYQVFLLQSVPRDQILLLYNMSH